LDVATFNSSVGTVGTAGNPVVIDGYRNIAGITYAGGAGAFTIGATTGNPIYMTSSGTIVLSGVSTVSGSTVTETINAPLILEGSYTARNDASSGTGAGSAILNIGGTVSGGISAGVTFTIRGSNLNANTVSGVIANGISSAVGVNKVEAGTWALTGNNTFTGNIGIYGGTLSANTMADTGGSSALGMGSVSSYIMMGQNGGLGTLSYVGSSTSSNRTLRIYNDSAGNSGGTISVANAGQTLTLSGSLGFHFGGTYTSRLFLAGAGNGVLQSSVMATPMSLTKSGTGTWTISGSNLYSGTTTVTAGTLLINGNNGGATGAVTVTGAGAILGGSGTIGGATTLAANTKLSAGASSGTTGTLTFANGLDLSVASNNSSAYLFDLGAVGSSDKITLTSGTLSIGTLDAADFSFTAKAGFGTGTYVLFDAASAISGSIGAASVSFGGGITGTLSMDNINNDILLTVVPEPSACLLAGLGFATILWTARRRSARAHPARK